MMQSAEDDADEVAGEDVDYLVATAAVLTTGAEAARLLRNERRLPSRNYLTHSDLPPNPHLGTAWQHLFESQNDRVFITTMGFDVVTFKFIIGSGFGERWLLRPIPCSDAHTGTLAKPRPGGRLLDTLADGALQMSLSCTI